MKRLYSPWRSEYIESFKGKGRKSGCLLCKIAKENNNDENNLIVWRGKHCFVVLNRYPYNSGHLMIVPYRHTSLIAKLTEQENVEIMTVLPNCIKGLEKISKPQGFNFGANFGRVAGAGIDKHIHFHLVPRWNGDTNFMPILCDVKIVSEDMKKTHKQLKDFLN